MLKLDIYPNWIPKGYQSVINISLYKRSNIQGISVLADIYCVFLFFLQRDVHPGRPWEVLGPIVRCKIWCVCLNSLPGRNWSNWLKAGAAHLWYTAALIHIYQVYILSDKIITETFECDYREICLSNKETVNCRNLTYKIPI